MDRHLIAAIKLLVVDLANAKLATELLDLDRSKLYRYLYLIMKFYHF